jgi:hypothetical protein
MLRCTSTHARRACGAAALIAFQLSGIGGTCTRGPKEYGISCQLIETAGGAIAARPGSVRIKPACAANAAAA